MNGLAFERGTAAVNKLGVDLYGALAGAQRNFVVSPLSIQLALAMTALGASGATAEEMQRVLRLGGAQDELELLARSIATSGRGELTLDVANRLFVQRGFDLRESFFERVATGHGAAPEAIDFGDGDAARREINAWVEHATHDKIRDLVPPGLIDETTRLVLANALYLRAAWAEPFEEYATKQEDFLVDGSPVKVPTMCGAACGQGAHHGAQLVAIRLASGMFRFVAMAPKRREDLDDVSLVATWLDRAAHLEEGRAIVHLPKFRIEPDAVALSDTLRALGLSTTFDDPPGSANFDAMAPRTPDAYLFVGEVMHKAFVAIDEHGVEAAAATAVMMPLGAGPPQKMPIVRIDRPFVFAIQHAPSGACLFLGRVTDPR